MDPLAPSASPPPEGDPRLEPRVQSGLRWSLVRQVVTGVAGTLGVLVYTRLLLPEHLGAVALAFLVYNGLILLVEAPIRDAVVYYQDHERAYGSAAFWLLLGFSAAAVLLVMLLAGLLARFYDSADAAALTRAIAVAFFLQALAVVPAALLLKHFRFAIHEALQTVLMLILLAGWVGLAAAGWGAWALILPQIAGAAFWAVTTWLAAGFRPALRPGRTAYRGILRFSRSLLGTNLVTYLTGNADQAAVGTLGERQLGWYSFGENQSAFAVLSVGLPIGRVALPAMAAVKDTLSELRRIYLDLLRLAATLSTPMQAGVFVLAELGIAVLFGEQWMGAVPVLRAYLAFRLLHAPLAVSDAATSALGRPDMRFKVALAQLPFFLAGIWFGLQVWGGIAGVAWSLALVRIVFGMIYFAVVNRLAGVSWGAAARALWPSSLAAAGMGLLVYTLQRSDVVADWFAAWTGPRLAAALTLLALVLVGVAAYLVLLLVLNPRAFRDVARLAWRIVVPEGVRGRLGRKFPQP